MTSERSVPFSSTYYPPSETLIYLRRGIQVFKDGEKGRKLSNKIAIIQFCRSTDVVMTHLIAGVSSQPVPSCTYISATSYKVAGNPSCILTYWKLYNES